MLRCVIEIIPDTKERKKRGTVIKVIDVKNDYSGSWQVADYKMQVYNNLGCADDSNWIQKVVTGVKYKEYDHLTVFYNALKRFIELREKGEVRKEREATLASIIGR